MTTAFGKNESTKLYVPYLNVIETHFNLITLKINKKLISEKHKKKTE